MLSTLPVFLSGSAICFAVGITLKYMRNLQKKPAPSNEYDSQYFMYEPDSENPERRWNSDRIIAFLRQSELSIDICVKQLTNPEISRALIDIKLNSSVKIRVVINGNTTQNELSEALRKNGISIRMVQPQHEVDHSFILIDGARDGARVITGAFDLSSERQLYDSTLVTSEPFIVNSFFLTFERLWSRFCAK